MRVIQKFTTRFTQMKQSLRFSPPLKQVRLAMPQMQVKQAANFSHHKAFQNYWLKLSYWVKMNIIKSLK